MAFRLLMLLNSPCTRTLYYTDEKPQIALHCMKPGAFFFGYSVDGGEVHCDDALQYVPSTYSGAADINTCLHTYASNMQFRPVLLHKRLCMPKAKRSKTSQFNAYACNPPLFFNSLFCSSAPRISLHPKVLLD